MSRRLADGDRALGAVYDVVHEPTGRTVLVVSTNDPLRENWRRLFSAGGQLFLKDRRDHRMVLRDVWLGDVAQLRALAAERVQTLTAQGQPLQNVVGGDDHRYSRKAFVNVPPISGRFTVYAVRRVADDVVVGVDVVDASMDMTAHAQRRFAVDGVVDEAAVAAHRVERIVTVVGTYAEALTEARYYRALMEDGRRWRTLRFTEDGVEVDPVDLPVDVHMVYAVFDDAGRAQFVGHVKGRVGLDWFNRLVASRRPEYDDSAFYEVRILGRCADTKARNQLVKDWAARLQPLTAAVRGTAAFGLTEAERAEYTKRACAAATARMCSRPVRIVGTDQVFGGVTQAARLLKLSPKAILHSADGDGPPVDGLVFEYTGPPPVLSEFTCAACGEYTPVGDRVVVEGHELCPRCAGMLTVG